MIDRQARQAYMVAILRDHALFGESQLSQRITVCRYFAWSRFFCSDSRYSFYFAWSRSSWWVPHKPWKQILSLFCVITLLWYYHAKATTIIAMILDSAPQALVGNILCDHNLIYNSQIIVEADFVAILYVMFDLMNPSQAHEADVVSMLPEHTPFCDHRLSSGSRYSCYFAWSHSLWREQAELRKPNLSLCCVITFSC